MEDNNNTKVITKIKLKNFKRFTDLEFDFDEKINVLIGDNESGKSSILQAIDIVLSGSRNKIENIGLENLFNNQVINVFLQSEKKYEDLPELIVELYLNEQNNDNTNGNNNEKGIICDGLRLHCLPNDDYSHDIKNILSQHNANFPFEFYLINFTTFANNPYNSYNKYLKHIVIDNSQGNNEFAMKEYVSEIYKSKVQDIEKLSNLNKYREYKENFKNKEFESLNSQMGNYCFAVKNTPKQNLETDLGLKEGDIFIEYKGKGKQCLIKTELALSQNKNLDIVLIEEPENHLSHINMKKLIREISKTNDKQTFITTHSDLISARLDLRKTIFLNSNNIKPLPLNIISENTAKFFMKAPDNNILQYVLSKKAILVEGDAEYILMEKMFQIVTTENLEQSNIHIIAVGGKCFKRYLELAKILDIKTVVITDNDGDYDTNITQNYNDYSSVQNISIFSDSDITRKTFEICFYNDNKDVCDNLFLTGRRTLAVQDYMLKNKADCAFAILESEKEFKVPQYISEAIQWIKQ